MSWKLTKLRKHKLLIAIKQLEDAVKQNKSYLEISKKIDRVDTINDSNIQ